MKRNNFLVKFERLLTLNKFSIFISIYINTESVEDFEFELLTFT
jgi:hypothetical protein